jgi:superfamily II DNA/RNA helicase
MAARRPRSTRMPSSTDQSATTDRTPSDRTAPGGRRYPGLSRPASAADSRAAMAAVPAPSSRPAEPTVSAQVTVPQGTTFASLGVPAALNAVLEASGITTPFPIQAQTLPDSLAGRDVLGRGRTGSGKTYAFVLPVLARLAASGRPRQPRRPRALILVPTRELASQIDAAMAPLAKALGLRTLTVFGGVGPNPQINGLRAGIDVLVACPGRLEDHISSGHASLDAVEITVLDEADHMADLGFLPAVRRLLDQTPRGGQRLLFSATLDAGIDVLVKRFLDRPVTHSVDSAQSPVSTMEHHVLHVRSDERLPVLVDLTSAPGRTLVFTRTKHGAKKLTKQLIASGVPAVELHGNLSQNARTANMAAFSGGTADTLVATDIAARGIHVDDVALVIHADPPIEHKAYLHRSGRTARAGADGTVVTLMTDDQVSDVRDLTRKAGIAARTTRLDAHHPLLQELAPGERLYVAPSAVASPATPPRGGSAAGRNGSGRSGNRPGQSRSAGSSSSGRPSSNGRSGSGGRNASGGRAAPPSGSSSVYSTSSSSARPGGAAAFSAGSRMDTRGSR